jgi:tetratricopeptide (TPR) repeat protein
MTSQLRTLMATCPGCKTTLKVKTRASEKMVTCPKCGASVTASESSGNGAAAETRPPLLTAEPYLQVDETPVAVPACQPASAGGGLQTARAGAQKGLKEIGAVAAASAGQVGRLFRAGRNKLVERRLRNAEQSALATLGEQLHKAGVGDPDIRAKLSAINEKIVSLVSAKASTRQAAAEQAQLRMSLAEPFLTKPPRAGMEVEHDKAVAARQALQEQLRASAQARASLLPSTGRERVRVVVGLSVALVLVAVALAIVFRPGDGGGPSPGPSGQPVVAQGTQPGTPGSQQPGTPGSQQDGPAKTRPTKGILPLIPAPGDGQQQEDAKPKASGALGQEAGSCPALQEILARLPAERLPKAWDDVFERTEWGRFFKAWWHEHGDGRTVDVAFVIKWVQVDPTRGSRGREGYYDLYVRSGPPYGPGHYCDIKLQTVDLGGSKCHLNLFFVVPLRHLDTETAKKVRDLKDKRIVARGRLQGAEWHPLIKPGELEFHVRFDIIGIVDPPIVLRADTQLSDLAPKKNQPANSTLAPSPEQGSGSVEDLLAQAVDYVAKGRADEAIAACTAALRLDPKLARAYVIRCEAYDLKRDFKQAMRDVTEALRLDPKNPAAYVNRGMLRQEYLSDHQGGVEDSSEAIRLDPKRVVAYSNRGIAYADLGQWNKALADHNQAIALDPNYAAAYSNRAYVKHNQKQYADALRDSDTAIRLNPNVSHFYFVRGNTYQDTNRHPQAIADYDRAVKLDPTHTMAYGNRGNSLAALNRHQQGLASLSEAIRIAPQYAPFYYNRANVYFDLKNLEKAIADYSEAIRVDPDFAPPYHNRANCYRVRGNIRQADEDMRRFNELKAQGKGFSPRPVAMKRPQLPGSKAGPGPTSIEGSKGADDLFQVNSVWVKDSPKMTLTVLERKGDTFRAKFWVGTIEREVAGTVKNGKISWLARDVRPFRGASPGGDHEGNIQGNTIDFVWRESSGRSGEFTLRLSKGP